MTTKWISILTVVVLSVAMIGCAPQGDELCLPCIEASQPVEKPPMDKVTGNIHLLQKIALSPDAQVIVKLSDVSLQDVAATVIAQQVIQPGDMQQPYPFELEYDPTQIDPRNTYAVGVRIEDRGKLMFINTRAYHVITRDAPTELDITVDPVK